MTFEIALNAYQLRQTTLPQGVEGIHARIGHALDSETLAPVSVWSRGGACFWETREQDTHALNPWTGWQGWYSDTFGKTSGTLIPQTFAGAVLKHKKGDTYLGLGMAAHQSNKAGVYVKLENGAPLGPWWVRPWSMFTPDRFTLIQRISQWPL